MSEDPRRVEHVDERTETGAYRIVARSGYGKRQHDKPRWWPVAFHGYKAIVQFLLAVAIMWVAKRFGWVAP